MKLRQLKEAKYSAPPTPNMFFVVDVTEGEGLVGPFSNSDDAHAYVKHLEQEYGNDVALAFEIMSVSSPEKYEKGIASLRQWMLNDED